MKEFDAAPETVRQIAQSLLEAKKMARSLENTAESFLPLTDDSETRQLLESMADAGRQGDAAASKLYRLIAREAMKA